MSVKARRFAVAVLAFLWGGLKPMLLISGLTAVGALCLFTAAAPIILAERHCGAGWAMLVLFCEGLLVCASIEALSKR